MLVLLEGNGDGMKNLPNDLQKGYENENNRNCRTEDEKESAGSEPNRTDVARSA